MHYQTLGRCWQSDLLATLESCRQSVRRMGMAANFDLDLLATTSLQEKYVEDPSSDCKYVASTSSGMSAALIFSLIRSSSMRIFGAKGSLPGIFAPRYTTMSAFLGCRARADLCKIQSFQPSVVSNCSRPLGRIALKTSMGKTTA